MTSDTTAAAWDTPETAEHVEALLAQMTLDEKIANG